MNDDFDPDLSVDEGAFEAFAEAVVAAVLVPAADAAAAAAETAAATADAAGAAGAADTAVAADSGGSVIAGQGADALYTMPDGSISFSGYGIDGTSYSFDAG